MPRVVSSQKQRVFHGKQSAKKKPAPKPRKKG